MKGKIKLLIVIGVIITALPILGFPRNLKTIILFVLGISIILLAISLRRGIKLLRLKLKRTEVQSDALIQ